eukprot:13324628-Ditylum_brightwellii.AAC.1
MGKLGHLCFLARSLFPQRRRHARSAFLGGRSMQSRKMGKLGHLCFLARSPFPQRRTRARSTFFGGNEHAIKEDEEVGASLHL